MTRRIFGASVAFLLCLAGLGAAWVGLWWVFWSRAL